MFLPGLIIFFCIFSIKMSKIRFYLLHSGVMRIKVFLFDSVFILFFKEKASLIYRNEVYGFQVKLGKGWKGGQIGVQVYQYPDDNELKEADIVFTLPYDRRGGSLNASIPRGMDLNSITINTISIQSHKLYKRTVMELKEN